MAAVDQRGRPATHCMRARGTSTFWKRDTQPKLFPPLLPPRPPPPQEAGDRPLRFAFPMRVRLAPLAFKIRAAGFALALCSVVRPPKSLKKARPQSGRCLRAERCYGAEGCLPAPRSTASAEMQGALAGMAIAPCGGSMSGAQVGCGNAPCNVRCCKVFMLHVSLHV